LLAAGADCPRTTDADPLFGAAYPGWYGSEAFAVAAPAGGIWPTTKPGDLISVKLPWRSAGYVAGSESNLKVTIENLGGGTVSARAYGPSNMYPADGITGSPSPEKMQEIIRDMHLYPDRWRMLTGMYFPDAGCWRINATYLGQTLSFVVETVAPER
jgi:hypothetical protein